MIYHGLARVVAEVGRRRRWRKFSEFLGDDLSETFELEADMDEEVDGFLMVRDDKEAMEVMAMMVEEAFIYTCLTSILFTLVYRLWMSSSN